MSLTQDQETQNLFGHLRKKLSVMNSGVLQGIHKAFMREERKGEKMNIYLGSSDIN
jgi:hypothetical protein